MISKYEYKKATMNKRRSLKSKNPKDYRNIIQGKTLKTVKAHTQVKKFQSLKLSYTGLYHRKSILSPPTLHLKGIYTR